MREWTPTLGARWDGTATTCRVWAPDHSRVDLVVDQAAAALVREDNGYWSGRFADLRPGDRYRYRLDGDQSRTFPDPASRFQPEGVHGPSQVVDPASFAWTDTAWRAPDLSGLVVYELHVGTFTPEGTFRGVIDRLDHLATLGVSAIELMPVGDFPGDRNWGYDGVSIFAPSRAYGIPDDLRALVDAAHTRGLAVFLDVVYNHLGPDGAYANAFSAHYFTGAHHSPWGRGVNLDGPGSSEVRRFFVENALHWVREYHVDGLRLDATHELQDESPRHFLAELTATVRTHAGRPVTLVAEDDRNLTELVLPVDRGGYGLDGVWADDFHHQARVHTAHDSESYYGDFTGSAEDLAATLQHGWFFTGQRSPRLGQSRGSDPSCLAPHQFIVCIQNHDQIGNRADGARLNHQVDAATFRALSTLVLLAPETPLIFMGQEWAASTPFMFFTDHHDELGRRITEGRRAEFASFAAFADPSRRAAIPDPQDPGTFARSRLAWDETAQPPHRGMLRLYQQLLRMRRETRPRVLTRADFDVRALDEHTVAVMLPRHLVIARLAGSGEVPLPSAIEQMVLSTESADVADDAAPIVVERDRVRFARAGAIVASTPLAPASPVTTKRP